METTVMFAKLRPDAIIPSKRDEDMGYDIYANFPEDYIAIPYHTTFLIPTGIASCCDKDYGFMLKERGSTGSKGIALRSGIIDSGYRNEWFIVWTNTNDIDLFISKLNPIDTIKKYYGMDDEMALDFYNDCNVIVYPYSKAIAQALVIPVPTTTVKEVGYEELKSIESERGMGALGSSQK